MIYVKQLLTHPENFLDEEYKRTEMLRVATNQIQKTSIRPAITFHRLVVA